MKIATIATIFIAIILVFSLSVRSEPAETVRFEKRFNVETQDSITLEVRVFGSRILNMDWYEASALIIDITMKFEQINYDDIDRNKLRIMFRDELTKAKEIGIKVDSISFVKVEEDEK